MPTIWVPSLLRDLTGGRETVTASGATVRQVIDALEADYPGIKQRLCSNDGLRPGIMVAVNTEVARLGLAQPVSENSEVHFLPSISGGASALPRRGWFGRNWKWVVPLGCLSPLVVCCGGFGLILNLVFSLIKNTDVYQEALAKAQASPAVNQGIGSPVAAGFMVQGNVQTSNDQGSADFNFPIKGPKGSGTVYVVAKKVNGQWRYEKLQAIIEGRETPIHLLQGE